MNEFKVDDGSLRRCFNHQFDSYQSANIISVSVVVMFWIPTNDCSRLCVSLSRSLSLSLLLCISR